MTLDELKANDEAPHWLTEDGLKTLNGGYLLPGETPLAMYRRVADAAAAYQEDEDHWGDKFFDAMWRNWLCPASPVLSNMGTNRGLPISCNSIHAADSVDGIFDKVKELAVLSKNGAGVGIYLGDVRGRGAPIKGNGKSEGVIPWAKIFDSTTVGVSQGSTRRGASAIYLPIEHTDAHEFIDMRRPIGDANRRCLNTNHGLTVPDSWMQSLIDGSIDNRRTWEEILKARVETGQPYLLFRDAANRANPEAYTKNGLSVSTSNICTEIMLHTDPKHSFVCCLSSLNLVRFDEWANTDLVEITVRFLDAVLDEYIAKAEGLDESVRSARKGRAIGIGVIGWHTLLQERGIAFDSFDAMMLNARVFSTMRTQAEKGSRILAIEKGEPQWCHGTGMRNTHLLAIAPTVSNSTIAGGHSAGIEPLAANIFSQATAKGTFIRKNPTLERLLQAMNRDTQDVWKQINEGGGSVQHLDFLSDEQKAVFQTAREINQFALVNQASQRQPFIDQGQSLNLFFAANSVAQYIHEVHMAAWRGGLKSLYYLRTEGVLRGDLASRSKDECKACEG